MKSPLSIYRRCYFHASITINGTKALKFQCAYSYFNVTVIRGRKPSADSAMYDCDKDRAEGKTNDSTMGANALGLFTPGLCGALLI